MAEFEAIGGCDSGAAKVLAFQRDMRSRMYFVTMTKWHGNELMRNGSNYRGTSLGSRAELDNVKDI